MAGNHGPSIFRHEISQFLIFPSFLLLDLQPSLRGVPIARLVGTKGSAIGLGWSVNVSLRRGWMVVDGIHGKMGSLALVRSTDPVSLTFCFDDGRVVDFLCFVPNNRLRFFVLYNSLLGSVAEGIEFVPHPFLCLAHFRFEYLL